MHRDTEMVIGRQSNRVAHKGMLSASESLGQPFDPGNRNAGNITDEHTSVVRTAVFCDLLNIC